MEKENIDDKINRIAEEVVNKKLSGDKFAVAPTPAHTHNHIDALGIDFESIEYSDEYVNIQKTTITSAQIKALFTTPMTILPAQGTRTLAIPLSIDAKINYQGTAYTGANNLEFRYTNGAGTKVCADMANTFINSGANAYNHVTTTTTQFTPVANAPIVVCVPTANPATGNGFITFSVRYYVVSFPV